MRVRVRRETRKRIKRGRGESLAGTKRKPSSMRTNPRMKSSFSLTLSKQISYFFYIFVKISPLPHSLLKAYCYHLGVACFEHRKLWKNAWRVEIKERDSQAGRNFMRHREKKLEKLWRLSLRGECECVCCMFFVHVFAYPLASAAAAIMNSEFGINPIRRLVFGHVNTLAVFKSLTLASFLSFSF